jgi:hypothetical protein
MLRALGFIRKSINNTMIKKTVSCKMFTCAENKNVDIKLSVSEVKT